MTTNQVTNLVVQIADKRIYKNDSKEGYQSKWYAYLDAKVQDTNAKVVLTVNDIVEQRSNLTIASLRGKFVVIDKAKTRTRNGKTYVQSIRTLSLFDINEIQVGNGHVPVAQPTTHSFVVYVTEPIHREYKIGKTILDDRTNRKMWRIPVSALIQKIDREIILPNTLLKINNPLVRTPDKLIYAFESLEILEEPERLIDVDQVFLMSQISNYEGYNQDIWLMPNRFGHKLKESALITHEDASAVRVSWGDVWDGTGYGRTGTQAYPKACHNLGDPEPLVKIKGQIDIATGRYHIGTWNPRVYDYPITNPSWQPALLKNAEITPHNFEKRESQWDYEEIKTESQLWKIFLRERNELAGKGQANLNWVENMAQAHGININWSKATKQSRAFLENLIGPNPNIYDAKTDIFEIVVRLQDGTDKKYSFLHENKRQSATYGISPLQYSIS